LRQEFKKSKFYSTTQLNRVEMKA